MESLMRQGDSHTAAILVIGDEILSGRTQDSNSNTIARFLAALGIDLSRKSASWRTWRTRSWRG